MGDGFFVELVSTLEQRTVCVDEENASRGHSLHGHENRVDRLRGRDETRFDWNEYAVCHVIRTIGQR